MTEGSVWRLIQRKPDSVSRNPPSKEQEEYCDKSSGQHVQRPGDEGGPGASGKLQSLAQMEVGVYMLWGSSEQLVEGRLLKRDETRDGSRSQN